LTGNKVTIRASDNCWLRCVRLRCARGPGKALPQNWSARTRPAACMRAARLSPPARVVRHRLPISSGQTPSG